MTGTSIADSLSAFIPAQNLSTTIINLIRGGLLFFWIISIIWTAKDSYARTRSALMQFWYIILVTIGGPLIGIPLYLAMRPARYRETDESYKQATSALCLHCGQRNDPHHPYCVFCGEKIHITCRECDTLYPASYAYCPDCGAPNIDQLVKS